LGQALATTGKGPEALLEFRLALEDPDLPQEQRAFAREAVRRVEEMTAPIRVTK
jgi:hypothetical protein